MAQKLWEKNVKVDQEVEIFTVGKDREMDLYLAKYDVLGSMAHITMLESIGLLTKEEMASFLSPILNRHLDFKSFILRHYQEVKTVDELAEMCHISIRSFNRKFNESFGDSPYSWMLKQKSRYVRNRLADGKIPFADIIKEFGFSSPAHFTTYCKKYFGCSPTQLRRKLVAEYIEETLGKKI